MAGGSSSSREQNFWPGFVDALTNVVLVMVFVVVVFAISMFGSMLKITKANIEKQNAQVEALAGEARSKALAQARIEHERVERLQEENRQLMADLGAAQQALALTPVAEGAGSSTRIEPPKSPVVISGKNPVIDVSYALGVTTLEQKLIDALDTAIGGYESAGRWQLSLQSSAAEPSPSEARRMAFYRIAMLRDHLVSKGMLPNRIETLILNAPATDGRSHVTIRIRKQQ